MSQLSFVDLPSYGRVWSCGSRTGDLRKLAREVDEYFALGLDIPNGSLVVDVGANVGMFAIAVAARARDVSIVAIEPIPMLHAALARNFAENPYLAGSRSRSTLLRTGLAKDDRETEAEFAYFSRLPSDSTRYVDGKYAEFERVFEEYGATFARGVSSHMPGSVGRRVGGVLNSIVSGIPRGGIRGWLFDRAIGIERVRCPMTTLAQVLDDFERPVDALKIDVEGAELDVLLGVRDDQWRRIRQVVLEGNDLDNRLEMIKAHLAKHGLGRQRLTEPALSAAQKLNSFLLLASRDD